MAQSCLDSGLDWEAWRSDITSVVEDEGHLPDELVGVTFQVIDQLMLARNSIMGCGYIHGCSKQSYFAVDARCGGSDDFGNVVVWPGTCLRDLPGVYMQNTVVDADKDGYCYGFREGFNTGGSDPDDECPQYEFPSSVVIDTMTPSYALLCSDCDDGDNCKNTVCCEPSCGDTNIFDDGVYYPDSCGNPNACMGTRLLFLLIIYLMSFVLQMLTVSFG